MTGGRTRVRGVFVDLPRDDLAAGEAALPQAAAALGLAADEADLLAGTARGGRADLWALGPERAGGDVGAAERSLRDAIPVDGSSVTAFCGELLSDRSSGSVDPGWATLTLAVAFAPPEDARDELDRFYEQDHSPLLLAIPGWLRIRRYAIVTDDARGWTRLALHDLADASVFGDPRFVASMETPWYRRLAADAWFRDAGRRPVRRLR